MADASKALGIGPEIEFRGKKYRISPWTLEMSCLFEDWLEQSAWDSVQRCRNRVPDDVYRERLDRVATLIAAKAFAIGGEASQIAGRSIPGQKYSFYLQLKASNPDVTERLVEDMFTEKLEEMAKKSEAANANPDPQMPPTASASR